MSNMSYCRFENTLHDLQDCRNHLEDVDLSKTEMEFRDHLLDLCREVADIYPEEEEFNEEFNKGSENPESDEDCETSKGFDTDGEDEEDDIPVARID